MNANERKILSTTCFGHFMSHFNMLVFPALVLPLTEKYGMGLVPERFEPRRGYLVFHLVAFPLALLMAYTTDVPLLLVTICYMFFLLGMQPIENTLVAYLTPDRLRHSAYGTKFVLTFGVGSVAVYVVGWIKTQWSLSAVFVAMAMVSLLIVLDILLLISRPREMG